MNLTPYIRELQAAEAAARETSQTATVKVRAQQDALVEARAIVAAADASSSKLVDLTAKSIVDPTSVDRAELEAAEVAAGFATVDAATARTQVAALERAIEILSAAANEASEDHAEATRHLRAAVIGLVQPDDDALRARYLAGADEMVAAVLAWNAHTELVQDLEGTAPAMRYTGHEKFKVLDAPGAPDFSPFKASDSRPLTIGVSGPQIDAEKRRIRQELADAGVRV